MNASMASFQFVGSRQEYHHSVRSDSTFQASWNVANGSIESRSGGAPVVEVDEGASAPQLNPALPQP